jgi:pantoate--beta-alanine ligase
MGALHKGHASLVDQAKLQNDVTVVSIFVNPTQFNNSADLANYPRTESSDLSLLENLGVDLVFVPSPEEIYTESYLLPPIDLGRLDQVMEGKFRPGHFKGVVQVVYRLFDIVKPTRAYFGLKDLQQVAVIRYMTDFFKLPVEIIAVNTLREKDGLAMSSRNMRLTEMQRQEAPVIYAILDAAKRKVPEITPNEAKELIKQEFLKTSFELEYAEIVDIKTLDSLTDTWVTGSVVCVVAYAGEVRLIDNLLLID